MGINSKLVEVYHKAIPFEYRPTYGSTFRKYFNFIKESQWWPEERLLEYQREQLQAIIKHAYENVPYYQKKFKEYGIIPKDIQDRKDLEKIPILTKKDVRENLNELTARNMAPKGRITGHTSGSTGEPLTFYQDKDAIVREFAFEIRHRTWVPEHELGRKIAILRSYVPVEGEPLIKYDSSVNAMYFSAYHMDKKNMDSYARVIKDKNIKIMRAYASSAYIFAEFLQQKNIDLNLNGVITSSETLLPQYRKTIEQQFNCKVFDWYGANECVALAQQCEHSSYHVNMEYGIFEIEKSKQLPKDRGFVIGTGLYNYVMPLIRYDVGDVAIRGKGNKRCPCGRELETIGGVDGRKDDLLVTTDGKVIPPINFYTLFFKFSKTIKAFQIYQENEKEIELRLIKRGAFSRQTEQKILEGIRERIGMKTKISFVYVDNILRDKKSGKIRCIVSKVQPNF